MKSRVLTRAERRMVIDAIAAAANAARHAKMLALNTDAPPTIAAAVKRHVDELAVRAGTLDRLAAELGTYEVRLERSES